jgi:hypothetical protein
MMLFRYVICAFILAQIQQSTALPMTLEELKTYSGNYNNGLSLLIDDPDIPKPRRSRSKKPRKG